MFGYVCEGFAHRFFAVWSFRGPPAPKSRIGDFPMVSEATLVLLFGASPILCCLARHSASQLYSTCRKWHATSVGFLQGSRRAGDSPSPDGVTEGLMKSVRKSYP